MESNENSNFVSIATQDLQNLPEEMMIILNQGPFDSNVESNEDLTVARYVAVAGENGCTFELIPDTSTSPQPQDIVNNEDSNSSVSKDTTTLATTSSKPQSILEPTLETDISSKKENAKSNTTSRKIPFNEKLELMTKLRAEGYLKCPLEGCQSTFNKFRLYKHHYKRCQIKEQQKQVSENVNSEIAPSLPLLDDLTTLKLSSPAKDASVKKASPEKNEKKKSPKSPLPFGRETRSRRAKRKLSISPKEKEILSNNEEESDEENSVVQSVKKKRKTSFKQKRQIIIDSSEEEIELADNSAPRTRPHRKPIVNKNKSSVSTTPMQRSIPMTPTAKAPKGIQRLLDSINQSQHSPAMGSNKPGSFSFSRDWGKRRKMYTKGDEVTDLKDIPTEEPFEEEPSDLEQNSSDPKNLSSDKSLLKKSILHSSTDSSKKGSKVKHNVRFKQQTTVISESQEGAKNVSNKQLEASTSTYKTAPNSSNIPNDHLISLPSLSSLSSIPINSSLISTEGTPETLLSNVIKNKSSLKELNNLETESQAQPKDPLCINSVDNMQINSEVTDVNVPKQSSLKLENTFETDSNSQNIAPNAKLAEDSSKIASKSNQKSYQNFSKKLKPKVVHDIYQLPPITANKADISMNSFLESPKIDNVVFSSLTNIKEKHKRSYIKTENDNDSETNDPPPLPINDVTSLYSEQTSDNSQDFKMDFEIDNFENSNSMDVDSPLPIEEEEEEEEEEEKPEPEYDEEAKKKLYFSLRWSRGRNRVKILENLKDGKSIEPFFKQAELSSMRGLRGRGRPRGSRAVPRIHHNNSDTQAGNNITPTVTRGRGRGRGRPRGVRGRPRLQRDIIEETKQQAPRILEMIRPYINNSNTATKVLIIPSPAGINTTSNMVVVRANLKSVNSDSTANSTLNANNTTSLTSLELIKSALQTSGLNTSNIDAALNLPSTSSSETNSGVKSKRKGRQKLVPDSSDEEAPEGPFFCGACQYENDDYQAIRRHIWVEHYGLARVNSCDSYTHNECVSRLRKAFKKFSQIRCKVEGCRKMFNNPSTYINHASSCGKENPYVNCEICSKSLKPGSMISHMKSFHSRVEVEEDELEFSEEELHELNMEDSTRRKAARQALVNVRNFIKRENFYDIPHRDDSGSDYVNSDAEIEEEDQKNVTISDASQISSNANSIYPFKTKLAAWEGLWNGPNYVVTPADLVEHWQKQFADDNRVTCEFEKCNKQFSSIQELQKHSCLGNSHPWKCTLCVEAFESSFNLYHHLDDNHFDKANQALLQERCRKLAPLTKAMDWTLEQLISSYQNIVFQHLRPIELQPLDQTKFEEFLSKDFYSLYFKTLVSETGEERQWQRLERFQSYSDFKSHNFASLFVGGTIKCASWCPVPPGVFVAQHLAIGTIPEYSPNKDCEKSLIQIWDMGYLTFNRASKLPTLSFAIALEAGELVAFEWCPSGAAWEDSTQIKADSRLGILAVGFKNGYVYIYSLPNLETNMDASEVPIFASKPSKVLCPSDEIKEDVLCNKLIWHPSNGCRNILAGFSNGLICMWNIETSADNLVLSTCLTFQAHQNSITGLHQGSMTELIVYTASLDGILKCWNLKDTKTPQNSYELGQLTDVKWMPYWEGIITTQTTPEHGTFYRGLHDPKHSVNLTVSNASIQALSISSWLNCQISGDEAGEIVGMVLPTLSNNMDFLKPFSRFRFPIFRSEIYELPREMIDFPSCEQLNNNLIQQLEIELGNIATKIKPELPEESLSDFLTSLQEKEFSKDVELISSVIQIIKEEWSGFVSLIHPELKQEVMDSYAVKLMIALKHTFTALEEILKIDYSPSFLVPILKQITELSSAIEKCLEDVSVLFKSRPENSGNAETDLSSSNDTLNFVKSCSKNIQATLENTLEKNHPHFDNQKDSAAEDFFSAKQKYGIVMTEQNLKKLRKIPSEEFQRLKKAETMNAVSDHIYPLNSLTTVCWNPNLGSHLWVFSGGKSGLGRMSLISGLYQPTMEATVKRAHVWFTELQEKS